MRRITADPESAPRPRRLARILGAFVVAAALLVGGPVWANTTNGDAISGDGTSIGGTNIAEIKEQIKRDRLSCGGGEAGASALLAVAALGLAATRVRRRAI